VRNEGRRVAAVLGALPLGWATATIGEIIGCDGLFVDGDWVESKDQDPKGEVRLTQLADVGDGVYRNRSNRFLKYEKAVQLGCTFLQPNDLMVARMPDPLGRACIFPGDSKPSVTAVDVCIVRTGVNGADHQWLMYTINSPTFRSTIASLQSGSTRKRISRSNLAKIEFPLPPLPEQHRIVAKIEELFIKLDAGMEALKKVKAQLKRYRQAVLKNAFEGKLTEEWREAHKGQMEPASVLLERIKEERSRSVKGRNRELPSLDKSDLPALPDGWVWTSLGELAALNPKFMDDIPDELEVSFIPMKCVEELTGQVDLSLTKLYSEVKKGYTAFRNGDILFAKITPCMENGKVSIVNNLKNGIGFGSTEFHVIRLNSGQMPNRFVFFFLVRESFRRDARMHMTGSAGQLRVPKIYLEEAPIPLPPLAEQHKIVEEIDRCFSVADEIEKVVEQSLKQTERLHQSILKRAFEGKLVPQDPTDEPTEELLKRIKAERAKIEASKKATGKTRRS